jgi:hypothetical protein
LPELKGWFEDYVIRFTSEDPLVQENIDMKALHTRKVCGIIMDIGKSLALPPEDLAIGEITALLHDVGRFDQYKRYGTFVDHRSEDHAALSVSIIQTHQILHDLKPDSAKLILWAIQHHNRAVLPRNEDQRKLLFSKLLRDADKIDIWRVVTDYYKQAGERRNPAIELDLPDENWISDLPYESLMNGELVKMTDLKTLNDFKVFQIGWIYDINYPRTFQLIRDKKYLEIICDALHTKPSRVAAIYNQVHSYLERNSSFD